VKICIPDLEVLACTNPDCHPAHANDTVIHDDASLWRITEECYRALGLLTPTEIRAARERLGLNQQQLQELLGLGGNTLSRWETGHVYQSRSLDALLRIVFNVPEALAFVRRLAQCDDSGAALREKFRYLNYGDQAAVDLRRSPKIASPACFLAGVPV
jgi:putative zinc finger/helix-turn-helix YgiT family protein